MDSFGALEENFSHKYLKPSGITTEYIKLVKHDGEEIDIQYLVAEYDIIESMSNMSLVCNISINDAINLMEDFQLSGNEKILIKIRRYEPDIKKEVIREFEFYVVSYPLFSKPNTNVQVYRIKCASKHLFMNTLKTISRNVKGNASSIITSIFHRDCLVNKDLIDQSSDCNNNISYNIPNLKPFEAIENISRKSTGSKGSPLYVWESLSKLNIKTLSEIYEQEPSFNYIQDSFASEDNQDNMYMKDLTKVLEISSDLKMSKIHQSRNGAFGSKIKSFDLIDKTYNEITFSLQNDSISKISKFQTLSKKFKVDEKTVDQFSDAVHFELFTNKNSSGVGDNIETSLGNRESHLSNIDTINHTIQTFGNPRLEAGTIINLSLEASLDDRVETRSKPINKYMSGKHLVYTVKHKFTSKGYSCTAVLKKDGIETSLN